jgi:26S proteasome regulatory subunit N3
MVQEQAAAAAADAAAPKDAEQQQPKPFSVREGMQGIIRLLEKSVKTKETRLLMGRLMRQTAKVRKHMTASDLARFIKTYLPEDSKSAGFLQGYVKQVGGVDIAARDSADVLTSCACEHSMQLTTPTAVHTDKQCTRAPSCVCSCMS